MSNIKFEIVGSSEFTRIPTRSTKLSAGYDFYSPESFTILPKKSVLINTQITAIFPANSVLIIRSKSGMAINKEVTAFHGLIDADYYPNPIYIQLTNHSNEPISFTDNAKIAQGIFVPLLFTSDEPEIFQVREGGLGSTGQ